VHRLRAIAAGLCSVSPVFQFYYFDKTNTAIGHTHTHTPQDNDILFFFYYYYHYHRDPVLLGSATAVGEQSRQRLWRLTDNNYTIAMRVLPPTNAITTTRRTHIIIYCTAAVISYDFAESTYL